MAIKPKLQSLLASANDVTGQERETLTEAVQDLVDGYGQGGESNSIQVLDSNGYTFMNLGASPVIHTRRVNNGILTNYLATSNGNYLSLNLHSYNSWRRCIKFKITSSSFVHQYNNLIAGKASNHFHFPTIWLENDSHIGTDFSSNGSSYTGNMKLDNATIELDKWYYAVDGWNDGFHHLSIYDDSGLKLESKALKTDNTYSATIDVSLFTDNENSSTDFRNGSIDISESFIECDGTVVWGKTNSKTANMGKYSFTFADFTQLDYLRSNGNQYLDIGYSVKNKDFSVTAKIRSSTGYAPIFSFNKGGGDGHYFQHDTSKLSFWSNGAMRATVSNIDLTSFKEFTFSRVGTTYTNTCDGNSATYSYSISQQSNNMEIFRRYVSSSDIQWGSFDLKEFNLTTDSLVRQLVPVQHTECTNLKGFFDKVTNELYVNLGSSPFILPS